MTKKYKRGERMYYLLVSGRIITERDLRMAYEICKGCVPGVHPGHYEEWMHSVHGIIRSIPKNEITIKQLLKGDCKVEAIKTYRDMHKCTLREAKEAVDKIETELLSK
jgi:hypothetical protein